MGSTDEFVAESNTVTIPFVDTEITHHDPFDLGSYGDISALPTPPSNEQYYAGVTEGEQVKKYTSVFSGAADMRLNLVPCFETDDVPSEPVNTFNELRIGTNGGQPVLVAAYNEWCAERGYDASKNMQVCITKNVHYPSGSSVGRIAIEAAYFKNNPRMTLYCGSYSGAIFASTTGAYAFGSVNEDVDMSGEYDWAAGDTVHLDGAAGKLWATDAVGNRIALRYAVFPGGEEMAQWPCSRDWLNRLGFSAWRIGQGGWEWQRTENAYTPGGSIEGSNVHGFMRWTQYKVILDRFAAIEERLEELEA